MRYFSLWPLAAILSAPFLVSPASAAPRVVADIAPVHSLVAQVMDGVGEPYLLLPPGTSPHGYSMRPSEAGALQDADLVFWVGEGLTPWLARALPTLSDGRITSLSTVEGLRQLPFRTGDDFDGHDHEDDHADDHAADHDDDHAESGDHGHEHAGDFDPHVWLDPLNARKMLHRISDVLIAADPANAARYRANVGLAVARIDALNDEITALLAPVREGRFIAFHDAYHYFEARYGIEAAGAVSLPDGTAPAPEQIEELRDLFEAGGITCVFAEPQFDTKLIEVLTHGTSVRIGVLDPIGAQFEPGPDQYSSLLRGIAKGMADCLS